MSLQHEELVKGVIEWMTEKKADEITYLDVREKTSFTDAILVCTGLGSLHNQAIANNILDQAKANKVRVLSTEGFDNGVWILIDLVDVIVHIFDEKTRDYYRLESFWKEQIEKLAEMRSEYDKD